MTNEYELKFLNISKEAMRATLVSKGYSQSKAETLMQRQTFHFPKDHREHESKWGRVRNEGDKITATVKWYDDPHNPSISDVHEDEITVAKWEDGVSWITAQGFHPTAYQENTREAWIKAGTPGLEVVIDTWPGLRPYLEVEAASIEQVHTEAEALGFDPADGIAGGTELVYQIELGIDPRVIKALPLITFQNPPRRPALVGALVLSL